ncbi:response regulator [Desulfobacter latus]|uniref:Response regulator n=1 Tax=Desulfobacter latus TaxID=2292 RepID=A0A850TD96_9BACT|nr:response regulator [Desulfobacter latus]NWH05396.1 response regulator [Desulfobacter latus]
MKLLFVENEQTFLTYLTTRMVSEGFTVKATFSGEEAVLAATEENFDVAIVELELPGIDGIEVLKRLRQLQPCLPSILLTTHGNIDRALKRTKYNPFKFLTKPVDMAMLLKTIHEAHAHRLEFENQNIEFKDSPDDASNKGGMVKLLDKLCGLYGVKA